jgi:hypothetical protein
MRLLQVHHLPDCPAGFAGSLSHAIHRSTSARDLNNLASFCPQFSQVRLSSSSVKSSFGGSGLNLFELEEVAANCGGDITGSIVFVVGAVQYEEHPD